MNPTISNKIESADNLKFTLSGINVSIANSIRRTILSDIPIVVFKTFPYEENDCVITQNTTRLNNEIIKQRLSCIPIHINNLNIDLTQYLLEVNVENLTDTIMFVTTEDFKIRNVTTNELLNEEETRKIFPPDSYTGYFIDFVRLRPKISDELNGEHINLTCKFSVSNAKHDGMFNVVSTCSYGYTPDYIKIENKINKLKQQLKNKDISNDDIAFEITNFKLLDGLRITQKDSFDFIIQSLGIYTNIELVQKACDILIKRLEDVIVNMNSGEITITPSNNTMKNSYDLLLKNHDYTIGKTLEFILYSKYYEETPILSFCGFKKIHPHENDSIIRIAYKENIDEAIIHEQVIKCINIGKDIFLKIRNLFEK